MNIWIRRLLLALLATVAAGTVTLAAVLAHYAVTLPLPNHMPALAPHASMVLRASDGSPLGAAGAVKGEALRVSDLPPHLLRAVMAVEDRRFYDHAGIDLVGILRAGWANLRAGGIAEGASTITQQLARTMFLSPQRTYRRKLQEMMIAVWIEQRMGKDEILARYLNAIYFGAGAWGIDGAARRYFGKSARELDLAESAILAGLIRAPSYYSPVRDMNAARQRAARVLDAMVEEGWLTPEQARAAKDAPVRLAREPAVTPGARYFADWVGGEAAGMLNPSMPPVVVETTLEPELQRLAEKVVRDSIAKAGPRSAASQAALVAMAPDGAVLAMVGGTDYDASQFNRAVQARRQAGSLFKLFVYVAALQNGRHPDDLMMDQPVRVGAWEPRNYDDFYRGPVTLRDAFAHSVNSVAVQLASEVGWGRVAEVARAMGVESSLPPVPALSLGAADVTLLEMTAAYAAVAADAQRVRPYGVRRMLAGERVVEMSPVRQRPPNWDRRGILDLLTSVMREGTAAGQALSRPSAGKTGTSQEHRDAWFVGFTADVIVGVWVGNDDNSPMDGVTGSRLPAQIWHDFMAGADRIMLVRRDRKDRPDLDLPATAEIAAPQYAALGGPDLTVPPGGPDMEPAGILRVEPRQASALRGRPVVLDTATLVVDGRVVRLDGVVGNDRYVEQMQRFIAGRVVDCRPAAVGRHHCEIDGHDLARVVIYNGGAAASGDAAAALTQAERRARSARRGLWGG